MTDLIVKGGTTVRLGSVEGPLKVGKNARITAISGRAVVVSGDVSLEGRTEIDCDLECLSISLRGRGFGPGGDVTIRGNLLVHGVASIDGSVRVTGEIRADELDIGGHLRSESIRASRMVRVGGHLRTEGRLEAGDVAVGGHLTVRDDISIANLRAGGHVKVGGGSITGEIRVGGHFATTGRLSYGTATVYGHMVFPSGCDGRKLSAVGGVEFQGDSRCGELLVSGSARVQGNFTSENIEVKGSFIVGGTLDVSGNLRIYGTATVEDQIRCGDVRILGKLTAQSLLAKGRAEISGEVSTTVGLRANSVLIGRGSKVTGPIVGEDIGVGREIVSGSAWGLPWWRNTLGTMTKVGDVHGVKVSLGPRCSARRVFGETVEIEAGSVVEELTYSREVRIADGSESKMPPAKSNRLIDPPL